MKNENKTDKQLQEEGHKHAFIRDMIRYPLAYTIHESEEQKARRKQECKERLLTDEERTQALNWHIHNGYDLMTIAQHYGLTFDQLAAELRN